MISNPYHDSIETFLRSLEGKNRSEATVRAYRTDLLQFTIWLIENNCIADGPQKIVRADIEEFLTSCARRGILGVTRARRLASVREYFRYLVAHGVIEKSPAEGIQSPKKEQRSRKYYTSDEYNKVLSLAGGNLRDFAIFQVFLQTGLRVSELCALCLSDIDLVNHTVHIREGKGMKSRSIGLATKGVKAVKNYLAIRGQADTDRLFLNRFGAPMGERGVRNIVTKYREEAGISKKVTPHGLRHTFATQKLDKGVSVRQIQEWLGHTTLTTTQIYLHLSRENADKVMEQTSL